MSPTWHSQASDLDGHQIIGRSDNEVMTLVCECGWTHTVQLDPDVVPALRELTNAGRDHIVDVLRIAAPPEAL